MLCNESTRPFGKGETTVLTRSIDVADRPLLDRVTVAIRTVEPSARIILYGSRARGDAASDSDWDFLVLVGGEVTSRREAALLHGIFEIEIETDSVLSAFLQSDQDWDSPLSRATAYHASVTREGVEL